MTLGIPVSGILARDGQPGLLHTAVLEVTGWPQWLPRGECRIADLILNTLPEKWEGKRVMVRTYPRTQVSGDLKFPLHYASVRHARQPNGTSFEVVGRLMRLDRGTSRLKVRIYPAGEQVPAFDVMIRATASRLRQAEADWTGVRVTGSVINHQLIADEIEPAYVPLTAYWRGQLVADKRQAIARRREHTERLLRQE